MKKFDASIEISYDDKIVEEKPILIQTNIAFDNIPNPLRDLPTELKGLMSKSFKIFHFFIYKDL